MGKKLFVGGLSKDVTEFEFQDLFTGLGTVEDSNIVYDRYTGESRGFGFVTLTNDDEATEAISKLNGQDFKGRKLTVNEARPREERPRRDFGGGGGGGGGRGGGGYRGGRGGRGGGGHGGGGGGGRRDW